MKSGHVQSGYRMLKPGTMALSFAIMTQAKGSWQLVQDLLTEIGFIPEDSEHTLFIDTGAKNL